MTKIIGYIVTFNRYRFLLLNLVARDFKTKYRRSALGVLWSVLNPLLLMIVITAVFENIFRFEIEDFSVYYLTGVTLFNLMTESTGSSLQAITGNAALIKKIYVPKYIFILQKCLFSLLNLGFSIVAVFIVMLILRFNIQWTSFLLIVPVFYVLIFSAGLGLLLATANVFFRDTAHLYGVVTTAWMFLTPIIYPIEILSEGMMNFMRFNPMFYFVDYFRDVLMNGTIPGLQINLICAAISFGVLIVGIVVFKKTQDKFILFV